MSSKRVTFTELVIKGLLLFSILTVIQGISIFEDINKLWLAMISLALIWRLMMYRYSVSQFVMLALTVVVHVFALFFTEFPLYNFNMLFYFLLWVLMYVYFAKGKQKILSVLASSGGYIDGVLWCWTILVGISALIPACYEEKYFFSFSGTSFRLMPAVLIITALAMYRAIQRGDRRYDLFLILPTYAAFMNQSRTYFGIYLLFILMYMYLRFRSRRNFYLTLLPLAGVVILLMSVSGIADKLVETQYISNPYYGFWETITNGRTDFWAWDLEAFFDLPFWQQFVGNGFNFVYDVSAAHLNNGLWAHNDVINLLMNFGYIGVVIYFWAYDLMVRAFWPKGNRIPLMVKLLFQSAVFINSMMNMSYTYLCAMISYPLFLCVIDAWQKKKQPESQ